MPTWKITAPDGKVYRVTGDDEEGAFQALQEQIVKEVRDEYGHLPWYQKPFGAANDISRIISNAPAGIGDKLTSYMEGSDLNKEKWETEKARIRAGSATIPAELFPMLAIPAFKAATIPGNIALGSAEGALAGGMLSEAHGEDPIEGAIEGGGIGGVVGGGGQLLRKGVKAAPRIGKQLGFNIAKEAGKLNIGHGLGLGGLVEAGSHLATSPLATGTGVAAGLSVPIIGALGRAVANPKMRKAVREAAKAAREEAEKNPTKFFAPKTRQTITGTGILSKEEQEKEKERARWRR